MSKLKGIATTWFLLWAVFTPKQRTKYLIAVFWGVLSALLEIAGVAILLHTILSILKPDFIQHNFFTSKLSRLFGVTDQLHFVGIIAGVLFLAYVVKNICIIYLNRLQVNFAYGVTEEISTKRYKEIANSELLELNKRKTAEIINELFSGLMFLPDTTLMPSILLLSELFIVIFALLGTLWYQPTLFIFIFASVVPAAVILILSNRRKLSRMGKRAHSITPKLHQNIAEMATGAADIKLWRGTGYFQKRFDSVKTEFFSLRKQMYLSSNFIPVKIYEVIAIFGILSVVIFAVYTKESSANLVNYISIYAGLSFRILPSVNRIIGSFNSLALSSYNLSYLNPKSLNNEVDLEENETEKIHFFNSIQLNNVSFGFGSTSLYSDVNLKINKGDFIGIVGKSGVGKSTLVNVITSLYEPNVGGLRIDGKQLKSEHKAAYRYLFSFVRQNVFMLNKSILHNIAFLEENKAVDLERVKECLRQVNLLDWVEKLPAQWNTSVGELGGSISGGQKQRIAIARALYKDSEIFIFDEFTNNLDRDSIEQTFTAINGLRKLGKTAIFITHKEDELSLCNRVIEISNNEVEELEIYHNFNTASKRYNRHRKLS